MSEIRLITVSGSSALGELERLRSEYSATGLYPILFGDVEEYELIAEGGEESADVAAISEQSRAIDPGQWFREKPDADPDLYQAEEGEWPEAEGEAMGIITHLDILSREPKEEVLIGLLKVGSPWEVFAHLNWGGWNDCPFPAEHCALHRYWALRYGAEVVSVAGAVVQCVVARPPQDREASLGLAMEQYLYCYDIVEQGTQSIANLAAGLLNSQSWYFWWD